MKLNACIPRVYVWFRWNTFQARPRNDGISPDHYRVQKPKTYTAYLERQHKVVAVQVESAQEENARKNLEGHEGVRWHANVAVKRRVQEVAEECKGRDD